MVKIACQQQWLFADENKLLERKIMLTRLLLELQQQRINQVSQQAFQAADVELKIKEYIYRVKTSSPLSRFYVACGLTGLLLTSSF